MKVLQILPQLNYGGVEVGTIDLAQALIDRGHKAYVISAGGKLVERLVKMGAHHYELPVHKKSLMSLFMIHKVRAIIEKEGIDIVHARSRIPAWIAYYATRKTNARFITTCHAFYSVHMMSRVMGWGERVIVISRGVGRHMIDNFGVLPERVTLIHRGVDLDKYTYDETRYSPERMKTKEKFIIANIARITPIKGLDFFIKAIHLLSHEVPHIEAWIVGGASAKKRAYVTSLQMLVDKLGIGSIIQFRGVEHNIPELLKQVDMVVLSTTYPEGFGRTIIEAGASGIAVVATKVGGIPDIIEDRKQGLLVPPEDAYSLSVAMQTLIRDRALAKTVAANLRKKVEAQFTLDRMIDRTITVYDEVRGEKRILVMKIGALGDIILAIPSLRMIRKKFPRAYIAVLVDAELAACLEHCPYINEIIPYKRHAKKHRVRHMSMLVASLRKHAFDISIDFQNNDKTHLIAFLAGIPLRYGYRKGVLGRLLTHGVGSFRDPLPPVQHQFRVLGVLGITDCDERLELWPQKEDTEYSERLFADARVPLEQKKIGFVLSASKRWRTKKWPLNHFVALAQRLTRELRATIVLLGDESSMEDRNYFLTHYAHGVVDMVGQTTVQQLAAVMQHLDCVVCGDTAPLHIASAMKTKSVALFGPTDPRRHMPPGPHHRVLKRNVPCGPCYNDTCTVGYRCMEEISVDDVFDAVKGQLGL